MLATLLIVVKVVESSVSPWRRAKSSCPHLFYCSGCHGRSLGCGVGLGGREFDPHMRHHIKRRDDETAKDKRVATMRIIYDKTRD